MVVNVQTTCQVGNIDHVALNQHWTVISLITSLFGISGPSAVFRNIVTIVVNALNRVHLGGTWPHVLIEILKRRKPVIADCNATASVSWIGSIVAVYASFLHRLPDTVFAGIASFSGLSMCDRLRKISTSASTGFVSAQAQVCRGYKSLLTTATTAQRLKLVRWGYNGPIVKDLAHFNPMLQWSSHVTDYTLIQNGCPS
jgi:hypothetical protein